MCSGQTCVRCVVCDVRIQMYICKSLYNLQCKSISGSKSKKIGEKKNELKTLASPMAFGCFRLNSCFATFLIGFTMLQFSVAKWVRLLYAKLYVKWICICYNVFGPCDKQSSRLQYQLLVGPVILFFCGSKNVTRSRLNYSKCCNQ